MVLGTWSRAIYGVRHSFRPAPIARARRIDNHMTSLFGQLRAVRQAAVRVVDPKRQLLASHVSGANGSPRSRKPFLQVDRVRARPCVAHTMLLNAARSGTGLRPGNLWRRAFGLGSNGSILSHNLSSMIGLSIRLISLLRSPKLTDHSEF